MTDKIKIPEVAQKSNVNEDNVADVLDALVKMGWLNKEYVIFNVRSEGGVELPNENRN